MSSHKTPSDSTEGSSFRRVKKQSTQERTERLTPPFGRDARDMLAEANRTLDALRKPKDHTPSLIDQEPVRAQADPPDPDPTPDVVLGKMLTLCDLALTELEGLPTRSAWVALKKKSAEQEQTIAMLNARIQAVLDLLQG